MIKISARETERFIISECDPGMVSQLFAALVANRFSCGDKDFQVHCFSFGLRSWDMNIVLLFLSRCDCKTYRRVAWVMREIFDSLLLVGFHFFGERVCSHHFHLGQGTNNRAIFLSFWRDIAGDSRFVSHVEYAMNLQ